MIVISSDFESSGDDSGDLLIWEWLVRSRSRRQNSSVASNMSVDSNMSEDSNAERDYEYEGDEFLTEPEIMFSLSTPSEVESQRGPEAESRFNSGAEASTSVQSRCDAAPVVDKEVADLYERGQVCPHAHFFSGDLGEYKSFCREYNIPDDVVVSRVANDQIKDKGEHRPEHITVPLMAICEAGLRFPLHPFLRELLARFNLVPHFFAINSFRIVVAVVALKESHGLEFFVADFFDTYIMSWHGHTECR